MKRPIRVVVAKAGLDGHDRGAKVVARALRDAGMEVIYTGVHQTPEQVVETALQEDADAIGLSLLSGAHNYIFPRVSELMKEKGLDDVLLFGGGIIPESDWPALSKVGVEKRLCTACFVTPSALLISDHERPLRRHWSTKCVSVPSATSSRSAAVRAAAASWARSSSPAASACTVSISSWSEGPGVMRQPYVDETRASTQH